MTTRENLRFPLWHARRKHLTSTESWMTHHSRFVTHLDRIMVTLPAMMASVSWWILLLLSSSAPRALSFSLHPGGSGSPTLLAAKHQDDDNDGHDASRGRRDFLQQSLAQTVAITTAVATTAAGLTLPSTIPMASAAAPTIPKNSIQLPPMGLGAWAWGDSLFWGCKCDNVATRRYFVM
jgi:hypothetical protein